MWSASLFTMSFLIPIAIFFDISTTWITPLVMAGAVAYFGDLIYYYILDHIDASITSIVGVFLAIGVSIFGFILFGEHWTAAQWVGAVLILSGVLFLRFWHQKMLPLWAILCAACVAYAYMPLALTAERVLLDGSSIAPVIFWPLFTREAMGFLMPSVIPFYRKRIRKMPFSYYAITAFAAVVYLITEFGFILAYDLSQVSLVAVVGNLKPFSIMIVAFLFTYLFPSVTPRELLTKQSVFVKTSSFVIVFIGLGLLIH